MPSASTKPDNKASSEATEPIKQAIVVVDKKVRNLEKRKGKLDVYRQKRADGEELNRDQEEAVARYDAVVQNLEFARELQKQFLTINAEAEKILKKQSKRDKLERQAGEVKRMKELLQLQSLLDSMGSDNVRQDFQQGKNGAVVLKEENLTQLDELYKLISPSRDGDSNYLEALNAASEHIVNFLDGREKEVAGTTYKDLKKLVDKVNECGYFENATDPPEETAEAEGEPETPVEQPNPEDEEEDIPEKQDYDNAEEVSPVEVIDEPIPQVAPPVMPLEVATPPPPNPPMVEPEPEQPEVVGSQAVFSEESFFTPAPYQRQTRPFQEIVSSVQGTFNFLQDSQIDMDSPHMDPAVVAAHPMGTPSLAHPSQQTDSSLPTGFQSSSLLGEDQLSQSQVLQAPPQVPQEAQEVVQQQSSQQSQQHQQQLGSSVAPSVGQTQNSSLVSQQTLDNTYSTETDFGQNLMSQSLQNSTQMTFGSDQSAFGPNSSVGMDASVAGMSSTPGDVPPAIPMPNQSLSQGLGSSDPSPDGQEKKPFAMNPNAAMFQSMYPQQHITTLAQSSSQMPGGAGSGINTLAGQDKYGQQDSADYGDYKGSGGYGQSGYNRNGNGNNRGGQRGGGGRGGRGGMPNGFPGRNNRGGGGGTSYNNNMGRGGGGNFNNRGNGRSVFQGYPPRNDYRPEGYQGYSNGFNNYNKRGSGPPRGAGGRGGGMRGGPPRGGGGMRGGNRGGFGSRPGSAGHQQHASSPIQQAAA